MIQARSNALRTFVWPAPEAEGGARLLAFPAPARAVPAVPGLSEAERARLDQLRLAARESNLAVRIGDDGPACGCRRAAGLRAAEAFRRFVETGGRRLATYRRGAQSHSADEAWLLRLTAAISAGDVGTAQGLIAFRIEKPRRRLTFAAAASLTRRLAELP